MRDEKFKAKFLLMLTVLLWASAFVGIRYAVRDYEPGSLALLRYLVGSIAMGVIFYFSKQRSQYGWREIISAMLLGVIGIAIYNVCLNYGERTVSAGIASFIINLSPIIVAIIASIFYREKLNLLGKAGLLVGFLGVLLIALSEEHNGQLGWDVLLVFIAMFCGAVYSVLQKNVLKKMSPIEFTAYAIWGGTLAILFYLPQVWHDVHTAPLCSTLVVIYLGIFPGAIAYVFWSYGFAKIPAAHAISYLYWVPFVTIIFGWVLLQEIPAILSLIGGVIALLGALIVNRSRITVKH